MGKRVTALGGLVASLLLAVGCGSPGAAPTEDVDSYSSQRPAASSAQSILDVPQVPSPGSVVQGVQMKGLWVIDVRNPDGSLASHTEFKNQINGQQLMANILARTQVPGLWMIQMNGNNGPNPLFYAILEPTTKTGSSTTSGFFFPASTNLQASPQLPDTNLGTPASVKLQGDVQALRSDVGQITGVSTWNAACAVGPTPAACLENLNDGDAGYRQFSFHDFVTPITISEGQDLQVSVLIGFPHN